MNRLYIVIPVVNCWDMTKDALASIKCSLPYTVILVDNDSSDDTQAEASKMAGNLDGNNKFIYIRNQPRQGVAASWNQGVKIAFEDPDCTKVAILNNDIILHPKTLDHLIEFMDKTEYLMVTADNVKSRMSVDTMKLLELPEPYTDYDCWPIEGWRAEGPDFSCFMINRETIRVIGTFDEHFIGAYCEDQDYHARCNNIREHAKIHNDKGIDPEKIHFKRLSTAPYFHLASQTFSRNESLRKEISAQHGRNQTYYETKFGGNHPDVMDGKGHKQPFGDATKNWRDWENY